MSAALLLAATLAAPLLRALAAAALVRPPGLRDVALIALAAAHAAAAIALLQATASGQGGEVVLARPLPDLAIALKPEPLGVSIAALIALLGFAHTLHTAGYLRAVREPEPARLQAFIALSVLAATGVALSANLLTLFLFYQALTLTSLPLVAHPGDSDARRGGRFYFVLLFAAAMGLLLPAIVWTHALGGGLAFKIGGVLAGRAPPPVANVLLALFVFGFAKAAIPPLHRWIGEASAAPFPAIGAILAFTVVTAGGLGILKTTLYIFGPAMAEARVAALAILALACVTMCWAALNALGKQDIRARLAYVMIAQNAAVVAGAMIATREGAIAAVLQLIAQSFAALTLIMAFAAVYAATGRVKTTEMEGLGRLMPWTFAGAAIGAASLIGLPPLAGAWPKLWLMTAAAEAELVWAGGLAAFASIAAFACLAPLIANAVVGEAPSGAFVRPDGASILLVAPVFLAAAATLALVAFVDPLVRFLAPIWGLQP
jgi:multicomponent Na+:H+ antiporter subunit D